MQCIVLFGIQGSGKGTQAKRLSEALGYSHINMGDLLRDHVARNTNLGVKVQGIISSGALVDDHVIFDLLESILHEHVNGIIFDGFPRTVAQADYLVHHFKVHEVFFLDLSEEEAIKRISSRRVCPGCAANYNIFSKKPRVEGVCDVCGTKLEMRADDTPEAVHKRFEQFFEQTHQLIDYFEDLHLLHKVDASRSEQEIFADISKQLSTKGF